MKEESNSFLEGSVTFSLEWITFDDLDVTESAYKTLTDKIIEFGLSTAPPDYSSFVEQQK